MAWCSDHGLPHSELFGWDPDDRAKLISHLIESAQRCQLCGTSPWEWDENRLAYTAAQVTCMGCYTKDVASEDAPTSPGSKVVLVPSSQEVPLMD